MSGTETPDPSELRVTFTLTLEEAAAIYPLRDDESDAFLPKLTVRGWEEARERARQLLKAAIEAPQRTDGGK